jgi:rare lipoprotein A
MSSRRLAFSGACAAVVALALILVPADPARGQQPPPSGSSAPAPGLKGTVGETQTGLAAYYSSRLNGRRTASGERYDQDAMTTTHQTLPFGTRVKVTNTRSNKSVVLRVNDRGPTQQGRIVDVSRRAARSLGFVRQGLVDAKLEVVEAANPRGRKAA